MVHSTNIPNICGGITSPASIEVDKTTEDTESYDGDLPLTGDENYDEFFLTKE